MMIASQNVDLTALASLYISDQCIDAVSDCDVYGRDYICVGDYIPWAQINCAKFCGLCPGSGT